MIKNINVNSIHGMFCMGGFVGWYLTVMYICEKSLEIYGTSALFSGMNIIFGVALLAVLGVMLILMFHFDFEGLLGHRYFRAVPALLMAESGIALAFTNADSFGVYAVITGICAAFGVMAVFSSLMNVRVSHRLFAAGIGTAIGGCVRLVDQLIYSHTDMTRGIYVLAAAAGILAMLTVRSSGFSKEQMPIISYSEASHKVLLHNIPSAYMILFIAAGMYYFCLGRISALGQQLSPSIFNSYEIFAYIPYILAASVIGIFIKFHNVTPIFVFGMCFMSYSGIMINLPYFSTAENAVYLVCRFMGQACFEIFVYMFIMDFAMDRQHPLFYAIFGYSCVTGAQLAANVFNYFIPTQNKILIILSLAFLIVIAAPVIYSLLKRYGLTQESFDLRSALCDAIAKKSEELALSDREKYILELVVLDGYTLAQLPDKMMLSRNTVRAQSRTLLQKLGLEDLSDLTEYFMAIEANNHTNSARQ